MGMPINVEIVDCQDQEWFNKVFDYFRYVDEKFSTYKDNSEINRINSRKLELENASEDMRLIFKLAETTKQETKEYFDITKPDGTIDPSGIVKGWAIQEAAKILDVAGSKDFYIDAGADIQARRNADKPAWKVGIRNPFDREQIVKVVYLHNEGMATSGTYSRGQHIYNPHNPNQELTEVVSLSVIGPNVYEADRFATAAFAMGKEGIYFIESLPGFEGYQIDAQGQALSTTGFEKYTIEK